MIDDQMSVDQSPIKSGAGAHSQDSSSASVVTLEPLGKSWAEEVLDADSSRDSSGERLFARRSSKLELEPNQNQPNREISLEFIDGANEEKFKRLVKEEKLKTPFKRRHSQTPSNDESRSNSSNNSISDSCADADVDADADADANKAKTGNGGSSGRRPGNSHKGEKRVRRNSQNSSSSSASSYSESDPAVLMRRQKQIDYGKSTAAYEHYMDTVPRSKRSRDHPRTPNKYGKYSRRAFDGLVKIWRKQLHYYDPPEAAGNAKAAKTNENDSSSSDSSDED